jgi:hypothetical protein
VSAQTFLSQPVMFGGVVVPLGLAIKLMRAEGHPDELIDRWVR